MKAIPLDGVLDLGGVAHVDRANLHPQRRRRGLDDGELAGAGSDVGRNVQLLNKIPNK